MEQSKIYLLSIWDGGEPRPRGITYSEEFAIKWCAGHEDYREYEEIKEIKE